MMKKEKLFLIFLFFTISFLKFLLFGEDLGGTAFSQNSRLWATYYGKGNQIYAYSITTDAFGNVYIAGMADSIAGITSGGFQNTFGGDWYDAILVKFDSAGNLLWATYYGGTG